jgi:hypothetical protein
MHTIIEIVAVSDQSIPPKRQKPPHLLNPAQSVSGANSFRQLVSHFCDAAVHSKRVRTEVLQTLKPEVTKANAALATKIKSF